MTRQENRRKSLRILVITRPPCGPMDRGLLHTPACRALPYLGQTVTRRRPFGDLPHTGKCLTVADLQGSTGDRRRPPYSYRPASGAPDLRPATAARSSLSEPLFSRIVAPTALAWLRSSPGRAWQNGVTANFNGKSREECAQAQWFAFPLLDADQGAIVTGEHGLPVRERSYRNGFGRSRARPVSLTRCGTWTAAPAGPSRRTRPAPS